MVLLIAASPMVAAGEELSTPTADEDVVRSLDATFDIRPDGSMRVHQELEWQFADSDSHGIWLSFPTRQPWDGAPPPGQDPEGSYDVVYQVSDFQVSSPTGAPVDFTTSESGRGSYQQIDLQIGDPEETVQATEHTYVVSYDVVGALRTFDGEPELYWNLTGAYFPALEEFTARVRSPEGVTQVECFVDTGSCTPRVDQGEAVFNGESIDVDSAVTLAAGLSPTGVHSAHPTLEPSRGAAERTSAIVGFTGGGLGAVALGLLGWWAARGRAPKDKVYRNTPPGVRLGEAGAAASVTSLQDPRDPGVRFTPPDAQLVEAAVIWHRGWDQRIFPAAVVDAATHQALLLRADPAAAWRGDLPPVEDTVRGRLFRTAPVEEPATEEGRAEGWRALSAATLAAGEQALADEEFFCRDDTARVNGWIGLATVVVAALAWLPLAWLLGLWIAPLGWIASGMMMLGLIVGVWIGLASAGTARTLTAEGTAIREQAEGFRHYIATAEVGQLQVEAEQDIFSEYLAWAVLFGLEERWARVCREAVAEGRLAEPRTGYVVDQLVLTDFAGWYLTFSAGAQQAAAVDVNAGPFFAGATGASSAFSGGGAAGGGGGGMSAGSW